MLKRKRDVEPESTMTPSRKSNYVALPRIRHNPALPYHEEWIKILEGRFIELDPRLPTIKLLSASDALTTSPISANNVDSTTALVVPGRLTEALLRLQVGTWINELTGEQYPAYMCPGKKNKHTDELRPYTYKAGQGGKNNKLAWDSVQWFPVFQKDHRFYGQGNEFASAGKTGADVKDLYLKFLTGAYFHLLPDERKKIVMAVRDKGEQVGKLQDGVSAQDHTTEQGDDEGDDDDENRRRVEGSRRFRQDYPDFLGVSTTTWRAYDNGTATFDTSKDYVCDVIRASWNLTHSGSGRTGPPNSVIDRAAKEVRKKCGGVTCFSSFAWGMWEQSETFGAEHGDVDDNRQPLDVKYSEFKSGLVRPPFDEAGINALHLTKDDLKRLGEQMVGFRTMARERSLERLRKR